MLEVTPPDQGHRAKALRLLAVLWTIIGFSLLAIPDPDPIHTLWLEYLPMPIRAGIWWTAAAIAFVTSFWPKGATRWGYMALLFPVALRAISYTLSGISRILDDSEVDFGYQLLLVAFSWIIVTRFVFLLSGWPDEVRSTKYPGDHHGHG